MIKIKPEGAMLIVFPLPKEESETSAGIVVTEYKMIRAEVMEVSDAWADRYAKGDIVIFPDEDGIGKSIHYQKKACLWVSGKSFGDGGDIWAKEINDQN